MILDVGERGIGGSVVQLVVIHLLHASHVVIEIRLGQVEWRGGAESIRQNTLFVDLFNLASADTEKRRVLYVVGKTMPIRFLQNRRSIESVLSKHSAVAARFKVLQGDAFATVRDYYETIRDSVEIVDLGDLVPALHGPGAALFD